MLANTMIGTIGGLEVIAKAGLGTNGALMSSGGAAGDSRTIATLTIVVETAGLQTTGILTTDVEVASTTAGEAASTTAGEAALTIGAAGLEQIVIGGTSMAREEGLETIAVTIADEAGIRTTTTCVGTAGRWVGTSDQPICDVLAARVQEAGSKRLASRGAGPERAVHPLVLPRLKRICLDHLQRRS
jgi:hypothetical protein